jgi:hypothetical protein
MTGTTGNVTPLRKMHPSRRAVKALARSAASRQEMPAGDTASGQLALLFPGQSKMNMTSQDPVQGTPVPPAHALSEPRAGPFWEASTRMPRDGPQPARSADPADQPARACAQPQIG